MTIDIGRIGIWTGILDAHSTKDAQAACRLVESLGFPTLWIPETVGRDPFVAAANYLAGTSSLKLATGIANIYARDPMTTVACQKTLAEAFPERFLLGLGVSHHHLVERLRKHDYSKPLAHMRQYLTDMDGSMFAAVGPEGDPGRVIAALGPKMLETAAAQASGAHPYFTTPEHTATARAVIGPDKLLAPEQMVVVETDPTKARRHRPRRHGRVPACAELPEQPQAPRVHRGRLGRPEAGVRSPRRRHRGRGATPASAPSG